MQTITPSQSRLLIIDIQEKLSPHIYQTDVVTHNARRLMQTAIRLKIPITITEHYPEGLGHTVEPLQDQLTQCEVFEKIHFSAASEPKILQHLKSGDRQQIIVLGSEAHVCVMQSALGLLQAGFNVWIVDDASSSRTAFDRKTALNRMNTAGIRSLTTEMLLFEWLERGDAPEFKNILKLIKNKGPQWWEV